MKSIKDYLHLYLGCEVEFIYETRSEYPELKYEKRIGKLSSINSSTIYYDCLIITSNGAHYNLPISQFKLILRQLSDMTEEEALELDLVDVQKGLLSFGTRLQMYMTADQFKKCLEKHFDLFGLHDEGLCLYKNDLK